MPDTAYLAATVGVAAAVTLALRAVPFALLRRLRSSHLVDHLGRHLPAGVMLILVVYLLRDVPISCPITALARLVPVAVTVAMHLWRGNALLSMTTGTVTYALALTVLPAP